MMFLMTMVKHPL